MSLGHRARTRATPAPVREVLGQPQRWPEVEPLLRRVRGTRRDAAAGQALVGVSRVGSLTVPVEVVPVVGGGSDLSLSLVVDGMLARLAAGPLRLSTGLALRLLGAPADRLARAARRAA